MKSLFTEKETQILKKMLKLTSGKRNAYSNDIKLISTKMAKLEKWVMSSISKEMGK